VKVELNYEQSARIELLSMFAGKSSSQLLVDTALMLLDQDAGTCEHCRLALTEDFIAEEKLEERLALLLHR
jgi:hypothetical protein